MVRNGISNFFVFRGMVRNGIPSGFSFRETDGIPTELIKISVCFVLREIFFFSQKMATLGTALQDW